MSGATNAIASSSTDQIPTSTSASTSKPVPQPFQCSICSKRFTRHENLKRHGLVHIGPAEAVTYPCPHCTTSFSRQDLRRRHTKNKHPDRRSPSTLPEAIAGKGSDINLDTSGASGKRRRSGDVDMDQGQGSGSVDSEDSPGGSGDPMEDITSAIMFDNFTSSSLDDIFQPHSLSSINNFPPQSQTFPLLPSTSTRTAPSPSILSTTIIADGINTFFTHLTHTCPFIHQPTFDISTAPDLLLLAMLCVAQRYIDNSDTGRRVGNEYYTRAKALLEDMDESKCSPMLNLQTVQACLLLQLYAVLLVGGSETKQGLRLHAKCIEMVRLCGLTEPYPTQPDLASDLDALWRQFARAESHKRTFYGVYQLDATWYQVLSTPRQMSHLEIKHEIPCSEQLWSAPSVSAWAHRSLIDRDKASPRYITAIRNTLSPATSPPSDPIRLDAYGSLLVILFILSSVREVSGWSTMTGRVCFERFEALYASTKSMETGICGKSTGDLVGLFTEAMWHMAMMELLLWSPAHTQGVVEYSIDAAIAAATHFAISQPVATSVESLNPHLKWFLAYLDNTPHADIESPWMTIYAFKASLVSWQLVRAGVTDHLIDLGIDDAKGMTEWMRRCFAQRQTWGIGRLVLNSMDELEMAS